MIEIKKPLKTDILIIGGGPGGLAAAVKAWESGVRDIVLMEREEYLGGILPQCIHSGFGLFEFKKEMTGPEYGQVFIDRIRETGVNIKTGAMALKIEEDLSVKYASGKEGIGTISPRSIILALGCRERTRGQINLPGTRPSGIFTAGVAQRMVNIEGYLPGRRIVILGSGDIGLIMARRLHLEGCDVVGVYELMPYSTGLIRNIYQCLMDYKIPLNLKRTVTDIHGIKRLEAIEISEVGKDLIPVSKKPETIKCDTLLLSVGLICENELLKTTSVEIEERTGGPVVQEDFMTTKDGIFSCGNSLFVNDIVDNVTEVAYKAAEGAIGFINGRSSDGVKQVKVKNGKNVAYAVPQKVTTEKDVKFYIRPSRPVSSPVLEFSGVNIRKNLKYAVPGELLQVKVDKRHFEEEIEEIEIRIETAGET